MFAAVEESLATPERRQPSTRDTAPTGCRGSVCAGRTHPSCVNKKEPPWLELDSPTYCKTGQVPGVETVEATTRWPGEREFSGLTAGGCGRADPFHQWLRPTARGRHQGPGFIDINICGRGMTQTMSSGVELPSDHRRDELHFPRGRHAAVHCVHHSLRLGGGTGEIGDGLGSTGWSAVGDGPRITSRNLFKRSYASRGVTAASGFLSDRRP